jgi:hypothetical protein
MTWQTPLNQLRTGGSTPNAWQMMGIDPNSQQYRDALTRQRQTPDNGMIRNFTGLTTQAPRAKALPGGFNMLGGGTSHMPYDPGNGQFGDGSLKGGGGYGGNGGQMFFDYTPGQGGPAATHFQTAAYGPQLGGGGRDTGFSTWMGQPTGGGVQVPNGRHNLPGMPGFQMSPGLRKADPNDPVYQQAIGQPRPGGTISQGVAGAIAPQPQAAPVQAPQSTMTQANVPGLLGGFQSRPMQDMMRGLFGNYQQQPQQPVTQQRQQYQPSYAQPPAPAMPSQPYGKSPLTGYYG